MLESSIYSISQFIDLQSTYTMAKLRKAQGEKTKHITSSK